MDERRCVAKFCDALDITSAANCVYWLHAVRDILISPGGRQVRKHCIPCDLTMDDGKPS